MEHQPLVTVVTGYYNRKENVTESVGSVLNQSYQNIEYIIFDDCSTDGTREELEKFEDGRMHLIRHDYNMGFTNGLIHAISKARGEYIAIHDAGDLSFTDRIKKQVEFLENDEGIGLAGCLVENYDYEHRLLEKIIGSTGRISDPLILAENNVFTHGEVMFRKSIYDKVGGYDSFFKYTQDHDLWSRMIRECDFYVIDEVLYRRCKFRDSVSTNNFRRLQQSIYREIIINKIYKEYSGERDVVEKYGVAEFLDIKKSDRISHRFNRLASYMEKNDYPSTIVYRNYKKSLQFQKSFIRRLILLMKLIRTRIRR